MVAVIRPSRARFAGDQREGVRYQSPRYRELLAALSSVLAAAFAEVGMDREDMLRAMRDLTASVLAEFGALKRRQRLGQRHIPEEDGDDPA